MEFEIPETLVWGQTIVPHDEETIAVTHQENALLLYGQLDNVDEEGTGCVRVGASIILIEIEHNLAALYEGQGRYEEAEPLYLRAVILSQASLGMEHPQTQRIVMNYLTLLSNLYTHGDMDALFRLLAQRKQESDDERERSPE